MTAEEPWTVGRLLTWTTDFLKKHGSDSARLDAEVLLAEAKGTSRLQLYTAFDEVVDEAPRTKFRELVKKRSQGAPVAYLVGRKEFYSLSFAVSSDVLIPRPETEHVVIAVLDLLKTWPAGESPLTIVDVGVGSGAIAVTLARHAQEVAITAVDISPPALALAQQNAAAHQVAERIKFVHSDLLASLPPQTKFDLIVSNPPYVTEAEWEKLSPTLRDHEPRLALVGGATGLEITARLVREATLRLTPSGWLVLEIHSGAERQVRELLENSGFVNIATVKDLAQLPRVIKAQLPGR